MVDWSIEVVASRFEEAVDTGRRLSRVQVQGYFNAWPDIIHPEWEAFSADEKVYRPLPPTPAAVERMLETMRWMQWLAVEDRHLVWLRARQLGWREIAARRGTCTKTAYRQWSLALDAIATQLRAPAARR